MANLYVNLLVLVSLFQYPVSSKLARSNKVTKRSSPQAVASGELPLVDENNEYYDVYADESEWQLSHKQIEMEGEPELTVYSKEFNIFSSSLDADDAYDQDFYNDGIVYDYEPELDGKTPKNVEVVVGSDEEWNEIFYPTVAPENMTESSSSRMIMGMVVLVFMGLV